MEELLRRWEGVAKVGMGGYHGQRIELIDVLSLSLI